MARPAPKPRKYEMMIVVAPTVTEDGLPNVVERVNGLIETYDGTIESFTHDSPWGHRRLAYPIQNFRDAFYVLYYFDVVPSAIGELDRELRLDDAIIRHLIVKFDPLTVRDLDIEGADEDDDDDEMDNGDTDSASAPDDDDSTADDAGDDEEAAEPDDEDDESEDDAVEAEAEAEAEEDESDSDDESDEDEGDGDESEADDDAVEEADSEDESDDGEDDSDDDGEEEEKEE